MNGSVNLSSPWMNGMNAIVKFQFSVDESNVWKCTM